MWLAVLGLVVLGAFGFLAWQIRQPASTPTLEVTPASQPVAPTVPLPASRPMQRAPRPAAKPSAPASEPTSEPRHLGQPDRAHVGRIRGRLIREAVPCVAAGLERKPTLGLRLQLRFLSVVENNQAHVGNVQVIRSDLGDADVEKCVLEKVRAARWEVRGPDGVAPLSETLDFWHLKAKRAAPPE
jgi:hypothetical protein